MSILSQSTHTCRKRHSRPCLWCGEPIVKGDKWTQQTNTFSGKLSTMKMHTECWSRFNEEFEHYWPGSVLGVAPYANDRGQPAKEGTIYET